MNERIMVRLTNEVTNGLHEKDTLPNAANDFSKEVQSEYFSNARNNMKSDLFHIIAYDNQQVTKVLL